MRTAIKLLGAGLALAALATVYAYAGSSTLSLPSGPGTARVGTDGSGYFFGNNAICDGAACANLATVKGASTAAVATDPALVVAVSPNNTIAATQSGTWNIGSITTLPNVVLGAGSANIGNVGGLGTAGTPSGGVVSVQGVSSMTPFLTNPGTAANWGVGATGSSVPANGVLGMMSNSGTSVALQGDSTNGLWVNIKNGAGSGGTAISDNHAFTQSTTNETPMGCLYATSYTAATSGNSTVAQCDSAGGLYVNVKNTNANGAAAASASSPVTPSNQPVGAGAIATAQTSCASTATSASSARTGVAGTGRVSITLTNTTTTAVYVGASGVTTSTGMLLPGIVGASLTLNTTAQIYCIVASGTATVTSIETY